MNIAKLAVLLGAIVLASGGIGAALAESRGSGSEGVAPIDIEARKNDGDDDNVLLFAGDDDDDRDGTDGNDGTGGGDNTRGATNGTAGATGVDASVEGRSAAQWMASAELYKERWLQTKKANERHAQQVRNLRAALRNQPRSSAGPRAVRSGGGAVRSGGNAVRSSGTNTGGGGNSVSGGGNSVSGGGDT